ncbi:hypothetical protein J6590_033563 [Homalodisca vitripennis]|nr:hypothetical protein J6590_033563 [Homalodisca vitripennis]
MRTPLHLFVGVSDDVKVLKLRFELLRRRLSLDLCRTQEIKRRSGPEDEQINRLECGERAANLVRSSWDLRLARNTTDRWLGRLSASVFPLHQVSPSKRHRIGPSAHSATDLVECSQRQHNRINNRIHAHSATAHSVTDLAGVLTAPTQPNK